MMHLESKASSGESRTAANPALSSRTVVSLPLASSHWSESPRPLPLWRSRSFCAVCLGLILLTVFRLWYCTRLELVGDEAYYWVQSRHLDMCYFDKGPAVAWTIAAGRALFGDSVFGIRFFAVLLSAGTSIWLFVLARRLFSDRVALLTVVLAALMPMIAVGSILMTIDPLSMFFWTVAACAFWKAKDNDEVFWWFVTGVLVGLGTLAKYTNTAEIVSFALFCAWWPPGQKHLRRPAFGLLVLATFLVSLPVWIWNEQHAWVTLRHLAERGDLVNGWAIHPLEFFKFLGGQLGVVSPLLFVGIMAAVVSAVKTCPSSKEHRFLLCLFLPLFIGYTVLSLHNAAQPNWTAPCYLAGLILLAAWWPLWIAVRPRWRWLGISALGIALVETITLHDSVWLHLPAGKDPLDRARGWNNLAAMVMKSRLREGADFILSRNYMTASLLSFYLPGKPFVYLPTTRGVSNQFSIWPGYKDRASGSRALFVSESPVAPHALAMDFAQGERGGKICPRADGRTLPGYYLFICHDLRSANPAADMDHHAAY